MGGNGRRIAVFPDSERVEEALCHAAETSPFVNASGFLTFSQLLEKFEPAKRLGRRPVSALAARVLVHSAAAKLGGGPFKSFIHEPAFARAALDLFFDLKSGLLPPLGFKSAVESLPQGRQPRARYLSRLFDAYESALAEHQLADREDLVAAVLRALREDGLPRSFSDVTRIELNGLYDFPPLRRELLVALAEACDRAKVTLAIELPGGGGPGVDAALVPIHQEFEKRAQELRTIELSQTDHKALGRPLAPLGKLLFDAKPDAADIPGGALELRSAATSRDEARLIARKAREAIAEGIPPEQIAIAYRDLAEEAEALEEALEELGVRARLRRGAPLVSTPAGRTALELALLVDDGFPADRVARLLGGRYLPRLGHDGSASVARVLAEASVRDNRLGSDGKRGGYDVRLSALAERLAGRNLTGRADDARTVRERCLELIKICSRIPTEGKAGELLEKWWSAVETLGIPDATRTPEPRADESSTYGRGVLRMLARDQAATESLSELVTEFSEALKLTGASQTRISRRTFHRWLHDAASDFNLAPRGPRGGAVRILDLRELPRRCFDRVFIGGATDGRLPGRVAPHPLLPDEDRALINKHQRREVFRLSSGDQDGRAPWRLAEDRLLFFLGLAAASGKVQVSWPRETDGREQIVSPFVDELARRTRLELQHEPLRPVPALDEVGNEAQLRERLALEVLAPSSLRVSTPEPGAKSLRESLGSEVWFSEARALSRVEEERLAFFSNPDAEPGPYTGAVRDEDLQPAIRTLFRYGPEKPLAATTLERFGNCAFQGFLASVLKLEEPDEPGEEQDRAGQGAFWHAVLEQLFPALRDANLLEKRADEIPDELIDAALQKAVERSEKRHHVGHPALWKLSHERARAMVRRLLSMEHRGLPFEDHVPSATELKFGKKDSPEPWREIVIPAGEGEEPIHLEGSIDRVDTSPKGTGIVDYKSSGLKEKKFDKLLTAEFQLPIYLYAAKVAGKSDAVAAAWLSLKDGEAKPLVPMIEKAQPFAHFLETTPEVRARARELGQKNLANAVHELVGSLRKGQFAIRPQDCEYCSFRAVCRISDRRSAEDDEVST
ncbi:MAG: PD-(D/E)XK nuclease family protein [Myxococcaceae bacterium]